MATITDLSDDVSPVGEFKFDLFDREHLYSPEWLETWDDIPKNPNVYSGLKPLTWAAILEAMQTVHSIVEDVPSYRKSWVELMFNFWKVKSHSEIGDGAKSLWLIFGEEISLRQA